MALSSATRMRSGFDAGLRILTTSRAAAGVVVSAWWLPLRLETQTSWDGSYSVGGLRSGPYSVGLMSTGAEGPASVSVDLDPGEWKSVDFGSADPLSRWTGTLRLSDGTPAAGPDRLTLLDLERVTGIHRGTLSRIERGMSPTPEQAAKLLAALSCVCVGVRGGGLHSRSPRSDVMARLLYGA